MPAAAFTANLRNSVFRIPWSRKFSMACECCIEVDMFLGFLIGSV